MALNDSLIRDQKATPGYVEIPACERLKELAAQVPKDQAILELGSYGGRSTAWMAWGVSEGNGARIYSLDCWNLRAPDDWPAGTPRYVLNYSKSETEESYHRHLEATGARPYVTTIKGWSIEEAARWDGPPIGLFFHDAAHHHEEVLADLKAWAPHLADTATVALHDAGNPRLGVYSAAEAFFKRRTRKWDWAGRELQRWPKIPDRRGLLIVKGKA